MYDQDAHIQVPGWSAWTETKLTYEREDGKTPHFRGIFDKKGRLMVVACHNMDLGDAWEHMDVPCYPETFSGQAYRMGTDFIIYSMTH